jgi:DNA-directed RNA polymerase specialized sigma24 family protein
MLNSTTYEALEKKEGKAIAGQILTDTLIAFRRLLKYKKFDIKLTKGKLYIKNKAQVELSEYLIHLFLLIFNTGKSNPAYTKSREFEKKLMDGQGFTDLYELKEPILKTLYNFGCKQQQDREDIFQESLLKFWEKLINSELGVYFTGDTDRLDNCYVYNCKFYQNSKIHTFLTGICKNLFMNRTRTTDFNLTSTETLELPERGSDDQLNLENESPTFLKFLYYRNFVEQRTLRAVISVLQHDCNLEEKEVCTLIGINNARIHSCRLKNHFYEWYGQNKNLEIADKANDYFIKREAKKEKLNKKIRTIDLYHRKHVNHIDLETYKEEFRTIPEFTRYNPIFRYVFYFTSVGKFSALTGLPDSGEMKKLMGSFKNELNKLYNYRQILLLLFYGSNEPEEIILTLLKNLYSELAVTDINADSNFIQQLGENLLQNKEVMVEELYETNHILFTNFSVEENFLNLITRNETL